MARTLSIASPSLLVMYCWYDSCSSSLGSFARILGVEVLQGSGEERRCLGMCARAGGVLPGQSRVVRRACCVAGAHRVVAQHGRVAGLGPLECVEEHSMQPGPAAGRDGALDRLPGELVPEDDAVVDAGQQRRGIEPAQRREIHTEQRQRTVIEPSGAVGQLST